jgi:hypothetical protein
MRYLRKYENYSDIITECEYIMLDLTDDDIDVKIAKKGEYHQIKGDFIQFWITGKFTTSEYIDTFDHLNGFLESKGYKYYSNSIYDTYEKRRNSFYDRRKLNLLEINYKKVD